MSFPESPNSTLMAPKESDLEELPGKEFKGIITTMFKQLKGSMVSFQQHKHKLSDEVNPIYKTRIH